MTNAETSTMLQAMRAYGGGFVEALAEAWSRADAHNDARLREAFHDYVRVFGPGSRFFDAVSKAGAL